jgi:hypothetical protein
MGMVYPGCSMNLGMRRDVAGGGTEADGTEEYKFDTEDMG